MSTLKQCSTTLDEIQKDLRWILKGPTSSENVENFNAELIPSKPLESIFGKGDKIIYDELRSFRRGVNHNHSELIQILNSMEKNLVRIQDELLQQISTKIHELLQISVHLQKVQIPKLADLTMRETTGLKHLLASFVPGLSIQLHFSCEHKGGCHVIDNQQRYQVSFGRNDTKKYMSPLI